MLTCLSNIYDNFTSMKKYQLIFLSIIGIGLSSCSFYNPISTNVPSYEKVGEVNVGVNLGTSADIQVSANPIEHLSFIGTASTSGSITNEDGRENNIPDSLKYSYSRNQFEIGLGYYYMLTDDIQHDFHVGYGFGSAAKREDYLFNNTFYDETAYRANISNFFIQSSMIIKLDDDVKGYLSSKFNYLTISDYEQSINQPFVGVDRFNEEQYWLNQLGIGLIADLGPLQLHAQGQINFRFTNELFVDERFMGLYLGVNFNISEIVSSFKQKD